MASKFRKPSADVFRQKVQRRAQDRKSRQGGMGKFKNMPDGIEFFKPKKGTMNLDFIPYVISVDNHADGFKKGDMWYMNTIYVHYGIGAEEKAYICPKTIGQKCPICDYGKQLSKDPDADEDAVKDLYPKERNLFNVIDLDDTEKGTQLWEFSYHLFCRKLEEELSESDDDNHAGFALPDEGYTLKIRFGEKSFNKNTFLETSRIDFIDRKEHYSDTVVEEATDLNAIVNVIEYDKLKNIFFDIKEDDAKEDDRSDEDNLPDEDNEQEEADKKAEAKKAAAADKKAEAKKAADKKAADKKAAGKKAEAKKDSSNKEAEDKKDSDSPVCPEDGGEFGVSTDTLPACEDCDLWERCIDKKEG